MATSARINVFEYNALQSPDMTTKAKFAIVLKFELVEYFVSSKYLVLLLNVLCS